MQSKAFQFVVTPRPRPSGIDVSTVLRHFALITYPVDPHVLQGMIADRFQPITVVLAGRPRALVSVVVFENTRFRLAAYPSPQLRMPQINYRAYVLDRQTGERAIWFLGTLLDSWAFLVPRYVWQMPWRRGPIRLRTEVDEKAGRYTRYEVETDAEWARARLQLVEEERTSVDSLDLPGFPDTESGLACLTHTLSGFYRRADGRLGLNRVWHERMKVRPARLRSAYFGLLEREGLVGRSEQLTPHSVLITSEVEFFSFLPPTVAGE